MRPTPFPTPTPNGTLTPGGTPSPIPTPTANPTASPTPAYCPAGATSTCDFKYGKQLQDLNQELKKAIQAAERLTGKPLSAEQRQIVSSQMDFQVQSSGRQFDHQFQNAQSLSDTARDYEQALDELLILTEEIIDKYPSEIAALKAQEQVFRERIQNLESGIVALEVQKQTFADEKAKIQAALPKMNKAQKESALAEILRLTGLINDVKEQIRSAEDEIRQTKETLKQLITGKDGILEKEARLSKAFSDKEGLLNKSLT